MPLDGARTKVDLRGGRNSDLVFALAVGLWWANQLTWDYDADREPPKRSLGEHGWMGMWRFPLQRFVILGLDRA
jgi:hypothetical protein